MPGASPDDLSNAITELDNLEKSWTTFYHDALAAGDQQTADFVVENFLQFMGFDPNENV